MNEKIKTYLDKAKAFLGKLSKKVIVLAVIVLVIVAAVIAYTLNNKPYSVLFTELNTDDMSAILTLLEEQGVTDYKVENSNTILVPESQEANLKAAVLMAGYPNSGFSYSTYYDNVGALSTEAERNTAYLIYLMEKMAAVVECFDGVKDAVVNITQGEDRTFVLDSSNVVNAEAGVMVTMESGRTLTEKQADAIRTLVSRSVAGLDVDSVSISDVEGNMYTGTSDSFADSDASALKLQLEEQYNTLIRNRVMEALVALYGKENVRVSVNTTVDVSHTIQNIKDVHLPEGATNGQGIIGSLVFDHQILRDSENPVGGVVGTNENSDVSIYVDPNLELDGTETDIHVSGQIDYNNPTTDTYIERTACTITDCNVAVTINSTTAGVVDVDSIMVHVARAAGINAVVTEEMTEVEYLSGKISVLSQPFYQAASEDPGGDIEPVMPEIPPYVLYIAIGLLALVIILVVVIILMVRRSRKKKKKLLAEQAAREQAAQAALAAEQLAAEMAAVQQAGADVMSIQSERSMELRKGIREFADNNPEIAAQMVRIWLKGGEENNG